MDDNPRNDLSYNEAAHAMQTGVAIEMEDRPKGSDKDYKDLRVGVNSAMCDHTALARLLIKKGLFTEAEYVEEVRLEMNREVDRYEDRLAEHYGKPITLR